MQLYRTIAASLVTRFEDGGNGSGGRPGTGRRVGRDRLWHEGIEAATFVAAPWSIKLDAAAGCDKV